MLLSLIIVVVCIITIIIAITNDDFLPLLAFSIPCTVGILMSWFIIINSNNPSKDRYDTIKLKYDYIISKNDVPFQLKTEIYNECSSFNESLKDNKELHDNIWIGMYYPEVKDSTITYFDLSKIK